MNFNFESPYIEYDSEDIPYSFYKTHGLNKIEELSRQLQSFLNFKAAIIQYRFSPKKIPCHDRVDIKYKEIDVNFKQLASKFIKLLSQIRGNGISYEVELERIMNNFNLDDKRKELLRELQLLTKNLFTSIHILSEQEIHLHPKLMKFIVNLTREACTVYKILNHWSSRFYDELRINYVQLNNEIIKLIPELQSENKIVKKHRVLEEALKEW